MLMNETPMRGGDAVTTHSYYPTARDSKSSWAFRRICVPGQHCSVTCVELEYDNLRAVVDEARLVHVRDPQVCFVFPSLPREYLVIPVTGKTVLMHTRVKGGEERFRVFWTGLDIVFVFAERV